MKTDVLKMMFAFPDEEQMMANGVLVFVQSLALMIRLHVLNLTTLKLVVITHLYVFQSKKIYMEKNAPISNVQYFVMNQNIFALGKQIVSDVRN